MDNLSGQRPLPVDSSAAHFALSASDPEPFIVERHGEAYPALVVCDHASNAVPRALGTLGLNHHQLSLHIAWDVGAAALARRVAQRLALPLVRAGFSRLVIDCNRRLDDPASILPVSDSHAVPGNADVTRAQRHARTAAIYDPYHAAIEAELAQAARRAAAPALISMHSFTPIMRGHRRPWHCGILWDRDPRLPLPLLAALRADGELHVGDNEPYSGRDPSDYTVSAHAKSRGWPHVCIEVRQDLLQSEAGIEAWSERLAPPLAALLANNKIYEVERH